MLQTSCIIGIPRMWNIIVLVKSTRNPMFSFFVVRPVVVFNKLL